MVLDDIKNIVGAGGPVESDETVDCIRTSDNFIPSPMLVKLLKY